jgi:hypothetical protein
MTVPQQLKAMTLLQVRRFSRRCFLLPSLFSGSLLLVFNRVLQVVVVVIVVSNGGMSIHLLQTYL